MDINIKKMIIYKKEKRYPTKNSRFTFYIDFSSINKQNSKQQKKFPSSTFYTNLLFFKTIVWSKIFFIDCQSGTLL